MSKSLTYSEYRRIVREETKKILDTSLNEEVVDVLNANLGDDVIAINNAKQGKPVKVMIVKSLDNANAKPPIMTGPDGKRKLSPGWTKVKGGLTVTNKNDTERYQKEAQELQSKANEGKGENDVRFKFVVTSDPDAK
jgi:hypothetical protein